jgi:NADH:ubiquinone oxidoreductase subunit 6 (subunit J)
VSRIEVVAVGVLGAAVVIMLVATNAKDVLARYGRRQRIAAAVTVLSFAVGLAIGLGVRRHRRAKGRPPTSAPAIPAPTNVH